MFWILFCAIVGSTIAIVWIVWRKWIAPWREVEQLVRQIGRGETPWTFLVEGGVRPRRTSLALEKIFQDLKQLDKQIAKRESGMQTIFSAMQDALLLVDSDRRVILANTALRKLFARPEIPAGTPLLEILRDATLDRVIADVLNAGNPIRREFTVNDLQIELDVVPTRSATGAITGAVVLFHDITRLKQIDQIRRDFVANVSHELRTPLSILRGYIETLLDNPKTSPQELARVLEVMDRHSKRLGLLVEDLLTLAELESVQPKLQLNDVSIAELFEKVVRDWGKKVSDKQLSVIVDLAPDAPTTINVDESRLQEVLFNLLENAVKYSRDQGEIRLGAQRQDNYVVLSVTDNGIGISKEDLPRIFERFYRADKSRRRETVRGTGLGLSIVKHIVQLHGGHVEAESELGKGTTIRVVLPIVTQT